MTMNREEQRGPLPGLSDRALKHIWSLCDTLDEADALLEPLAALWHESWSEWPDGRPVWMHSENAITVGDVRKARAYLKRREGER